MSRRAWAITLGMAMACAILVVGAPESVVAGQAQAPGALPASCSGPIAITRGGTYSGCWRSTGSEPAVSVETRDPVVIVNSTVAGPSDLIRASRGARLQVRQVTGLGGAGRFLWSRGIADLVVRNSTILKTTGIRLDDSEDSARVLVTRNRAREIQGADYKTVFFQAANVQRARIEVSWNEVINTFGSSGVEDIISIFETANASIHDNYLQGAYPRDASAQFSGSGIMIEGAGSHHNTIASNQIVETTNAGFGIAGGHHNRAYDNRLIFDGRLWDGTRLAAANVGFYVWNMPDDPDFGDNDVFRNTVGWVTARGGRNDWWLPDCVGICANRRLTGALNRNRELGEFGLWTKKLAGNRIRIGRTVGLKS